MALGKIALTNSQPVFAIGWNSHDDKLFLSLADSLLHGQWLGDYNNLTLAKGSFYPIWIALNSLLGMPLLTSQQLLYAFSCLMFVLALRPLKLKPMILLLVYALLLFNPISYANGPSTRVIREGIYASETLLVVAGFMALFLRWNWEMKSVVRWSMISGFSLAALWITREEGIWILPTVFFLTVVPAFWIFKNRLENRFKRLALLALPFGLLIISISLISALNFYHYGIFTPVEYKQKDFLSAYGALTRVKHNSWQPDIPVPAETRMRIYKVSPAFAELKPYLEGDIGKAWSSNSVFWRPATEEWVADQQNLEISGGWFMWALRDAAAAAGHYTSGEAAATYYRRLASEVNTAIAQGKLEAARGVKATMTPLWHKEYLSPLLKAMAKSAVFMINFREFDPRPSYSIGNDSQLALFRDITRDKLSQSPKMRVTGWAVNSESPLDITIHTADGKILDSSIQREQSPDVYPHFQSLPWASEARFSITTTKLTGENLYLSLKNNHGSVEKIPLDGAIKRFQSAKTQGNIEAVSTVTNNSLAQNLGIRYLESIGRIYGLILPPFVILSLVYYFIFSLKMFRSLNNFMIWVISSAILGAIFIRIFIVSFIHVSSFPGVNTLYLSPAYPLMLAFVSVMMSKITNSLGRL